MKFQLLRVDLTENNLRNELIKEDILKKFIGGRGLGVKILFDELRPGTDPLSPENKLLFLTGPCTGSLFPLSGRFHVVTKSPLTGGIGDSNCGGDWGPELKFAGFDGILVEGTSKSPVYLLIHDGKAEFKDASRIWGKGVWDTEDLIRAETGNRNLKLASIGPAGENLVLIAGIMNDKHRAAGRAGVGAVMGSKKLKAIAVRGNAQLKAVDPSAMSRAAKTAIDKIKATETTAKTLPDLGTSALVNAINERGGYPTRNFQTGVFETADKTSGETIKNTILVKGKACWGCIVACGRVTHVKESPYQVQGEGPEYETTWSLGAMCGIDNLPAITYAHNLCDDMGIDQISFGSTVACAMELYEKGLLPREKLAGLELKFGNPQAIVELAWRTAYRTGFGDDIALGSKRLAEKYNAPDSAMHVKGLELPAYDPRAFQGHGLGYATSNRGGCHLRAYMISPEVLDIPVKLDRFETKEKAKWVKWYQDYYSVIDSLVVCKFLSFALLPEDMVPLLNATTGWEWTVDDFMKAGERIYNLERMFINREGFGRKDDTLPMRLLKEPLPEGPSKGWVSHLDKMLDEYYDLRGWKDGLPTDTKLEQLDLP
jgi:aldehyde:ferredoxin oxidoreductase